MVAGDSNPKIKSSPEEVWRQLLLVRRDDFHIYNHRHQQPVIDSIILHTLSYDCLLE